MKFLLDISYMGTRFRGFQSQNGSGDTVQETVTTAAREAFGVPCDVTGCSRTDSGVHALSYCLTVAPADPADRITVPAEKIPFAMNAKLPQDVAVRSARAVPDDFHPRYHAKTKQYLYRIRTAPIRDPFEAGRVLEYGRTIDDETLSRMRETAECFLGTHDFRAFMAKGSDVGDTVRTVTYVSLTRNGDTVEFRVAANGFLYNMVRIMTGTLLSAAAGKIDASTVLRAFEIGDRDLLGATAPACGLYLEKVTYED